MRHEQVYAQLMFLAGVPIPDRLVLTSPGNFRDAGLDNTAERLETAYDRETKVLALNVPERDESLSVLVDCPEALLELRAALLEEHVWRVAEGLS